MVEVVPTLDINGLDEVEATGEECSGVALMYVMLSWGSVLGLVSGMGLEMILAVYTEYGVKGTSLFVFIHSSSQVSLRTITESVKSGQKMSNPSAASSLSR